MSEDECYRCQELDVLILQDCIQVILGTKVELFRAVRKTLFFLVLVINNVQSDSVFLHCHLYSSVT